MIERKKKRTARVGTFAVGHKTYWWQFEGLLDNLLGYHNTFIGMLRENEVEVVDFGMSDDSIEAYRILDRMKSAGLDMIFCDMVTYATSSCFAPIIREMNVPMVLVALQPLEGLDYSRACTI